MTTEFTGFPEIKFSSIESIKKWRAQMNAIHAEIHSVLTDVLDKETDAAALSHALHNALQPYNDTTWEQLLACEDGDAVEVYHSEEIDSRILIRNADAWCIQTNPQEDEGKAGASNTGHAQVASELMTLVWWGDAAWAESLAKQELDARQHK